MNQERDGVIVRDNRKRCRKMWVGGGDGGGEGRGRMN